MKFGYIREWEEERGQSRARQRLLNQVGDDGFLFSDTRSRSYERPNYLLMRNMLRAGDVLFVDGLDSLGYTAEEMTAEWRLLTKQIQIDVIVLDETFQIDSRVYQKMGEAGLQIEQQMFHMLLYADILQQRRKEEQQRICTNIVPKKAGRPPLPLDYNLFHETAQRWASAEIDIEEACEITGHTRSTWYKHTRDLGYIRKNKRTVKK